MNNLDTSSITVLVYSFLVVISAVISLAICSNWRCRLRRSKGLEVVIEDENDEIRLQNYGDSTKGYKGTDAFRNYSRDSYNLNLKTVVDDKLPVARVAPMTPPPNPNI